MATYLSKSEMETFQTGQRIGERIRKPTTILLFGGLGTGKTVLTRGIAFGLGVADPSSVHSPSFTLVNLYPSSRGTLVHIDLYRLETTRDLYSIGIEEFLDGNSIVVIEWAEKLPFQIPDALVIKIHLGREPDHRTIEVIGDDRLTG